MLKKEECKIFENGDYVVEVQKDIKDESVVNFYLFNRNYGIKSLIFGFQMDFNDDSLIEEYIEKNIEDYKEIYQEEYEELVNQ